MTSEGAFGDISNSTGDASSFQERVDDSLLSTLPDFRVFGRLFDTMFLFAAMGTAIYQFVAMKVNPAEETGEIYQA